MTMDFLALLEKPKKIRRLFIIIARLTINTIAGVYLYQYFYGRIDWYQFTNWQSWVLLITSGRVLLWALMYGISELLLFQVLTLFAVSFIEGVTDWFISKKPEEDIGGLVRWLIKRADFGYFPRHQNEMKPLSETRRFYILLKPFVHPQARSAIRKLKDSYIRYILNLALTFTAVYFIVFASALRQHTLDKIVIALLLVAVFVYMSLSAWLHILYVSGPYLFVLVKRAYYEQQLTDFLHRERKHVIPVSDAKGRFLSDAIFVHSAGYFFQVLAMDKVKLERFAADFLDHDKTGYRLVIFYNGPVEQQQLDRWHGSDKLTVVPFDNRKGLLEAATAFLHPETA